MYSSLCRPQHVQLDFPKSKACFEEPDDNDTAVPHNQGTRKRNSQHRLRFTADLMNIAKLDFLEQGIILLDEIRHCFLKTIAKWEELQKHFEIAASQMLG